MLTADGASRQTNQLPAPVLGPVERPASGAGGQAQVAALGAEGFGEHLANAGVADARLHHLEDRIAAVDAAQLLREAQEPLVVGADAEAGIERTHLGDQLAANQHARVGDRH